MYVTLDLKHSLKEQISNSVSAANQLNTSYIHIVIYIYIHRATFLLRGLSFLTFKIRVLNLIIL